MDNYPHIFIIVCDTLGAKHMSLYGYERDTTPKLRRLIEEGHFALYNRCFAPAPWTAPSHASLFTGLYPSQHKTVGKQVILDTNLRLLTEVISSSYKCYGFSNNGLIGKFSNYHIGFSEFFECNKHIPYIKLQLLYEQIENYSSKLKRISKLSRLFFFDYLSVLKLLNIKIKKKEFSIFEDSTPYTVYTLERAKHIIKQHDSNQKPLFLFINLMQTHGKYNPPSLTRGKFSKSLYKKEFDDLYKEEDIWFDYYLNPHKKYWKDFLCYLSALYDEEILFLDTILCDFLSYLKSHNFWDNSVIIITSDHGELFGEHRHVHHVFTTYNELTHIPLIIKWNKDINISGIISDIVQLHDLYSTIYDLCSIPLPKPIFSKSLLESEKRKLAIIQLVDVGYKIKALINRDEEFIPNQDMQPMMSIITQDMWKVTKYLDNHTKIFDLTKDFYEETDLTEIEREKAKSLTKNIEMIDKILEFKEIAQKTINNDEL